MASSYVNKTMSLEQAKSIYLTGWTKRSYKLFLFVADRCFDYSQAVEVRKFPNAL